MFDIVVFSEEELLSALERGYTSVCLCDGRFVIPCRENISYSAVGKVHAMVLCCEADADALNIRFKNFTPQFGNISVVPYRSGSGSGGMHCEKFADRFVSGYGINNI